MYPDNPLLYLPRRYYWAIPSSSCRRLTPLGRAGMETPTNPGALPGETGHQYVTVDFPSLFPLLSFSYFISPSLSLPLSLPFPSGFFTCSPFSGNGPAPRSSQAAIVHKIVAPGRRVAPLWTLHTLWTLWTPRRPSSRRENFAPQRFECSRGET